MNLDDNKSGNGKKFMILLNIGFLSDRMMTRSFFLTYDNRF